MREIAAWEKVRNKNHTKANWQFTTEKARVKLKNFYHTPMRNYVAKRR